MLHTELKSTILYCFKENGRYMDFYPSKLQVQMCGVGNEDIVKVKVSQALYNEVTTHYGWWDNKDNCFCMIFESYHQLAMCFPYGIKDEEERGRGLACNLKVEEIE